MVWAISLIGLFYLFTLVLGYGAGALVGPDAIKKAPGGADSAAPLLAYQLGGTILLGIIAAVAFATILAVVAGLTITASASFAHDIYVNVIKHGVVEDAAHLKVKVARRTAIIIGIVAILGGILANGQNIAFLVALAFAVAASANLPTILYSLFWKRLNTTGALCSIYGGLGITLILIIFSPVVSGKPVDPVTGRSASMLQGVELSIGRIDFYEHASDAEVAARYGAVDLCVMMPTPDGQGARPGPGNRFVAVRPDRRMLLQMKDLDWTLMGYLDRRTNAFLTPEQAGRRPATGPKPTNLEPAPPNRQEGSHGKS